MVVHNIKEMSVYVEKADKMKTLIHGKKQIAMILLHCAHH